EPGEDHPRVARVDAHVRAAGLVVLEEHPVPALAAVGSAVEAAVLVRAEGVAEDRGEGHVRVLRVDGHRADLPDLLPDVLPRLAGVGALEDADAGRDVPADVRLAAADVDHVRVARGDGDGTDGGGGLVVKDRLPGEPAVGGLPDPAGGRGRVVRQRVAG